MDKMNRNAFAINYKKEMNAPEVSSALNGIHAEEIVKFCRKNGIPVKKSTDLSQKLKDVPPSTEIPPDLYKDVAEIFLAIDASLRVK